MMLFFAISDMRAICCYAGAMIALPHAILRADAAADSDYVLFLMLRHAADADAAAYDTLYFSARRFRCLCLQYADAAFADAELRLFRLRRFRLLLR